MINQSEDSILSVERRAVECRVVSASIKSCESHDYGGCFRLHDRSNTAVARRHMEAINLLHKVLVIDVT